MGEEDKNDIGYAAAHRSGYVAGNETSTPEGQKTDAVGDNGESHGLKTMTGMGPQEGTNPIGEISVSTGAKINPGAYNAKYDETARQEAQDNFNDREILKSKEKVADIYQQMIDRMKAPESEEDRAKREKRERSRRIIGAVSDGLRSLGNLFFTSQYAPDMYDRSTRQLDRTNRWIEKMKAQRDKDEADYYNLVINGANAEGDLAKTRADLEALREARKQRRKEAEIKQAEHEAKMKLQPYLEQKAAAEAEGAGYKRDSAKSDADYRPMMNEAKLANEGLKGSKIRADIQRSLAQAQKAVKDGNKNSFEFMGKHYSNEKDYIKAIEKAVSAYNYEGAEKEADGVTVKKKVRLNSEGQPVKNSDGTYVKDIVYKEGFEPIKSGYWTEIGNDYQWKDYDPSKVAGHTEDAYRQKEEAEKKGAGSWSLKDKEKGTGGWSLK